jgi:hypothetical protein
LRLTGANTPLFKSSFYSNLRAAELFQGKLIHFFYNFFFSFALGGSREKSLKSLIGERTVIMGNKVLLAGDVLSVSGDTAVVRTIAFTRKNDQVQEWPQVHKVVLNGAKITEGTKVQLIGKLDVFDKITMVSCDPASPTKIKKSQKDPQTGFPFYKNIVEITGRLAGEFQYFPRDPIAKKPPMAGFLVAVQVAATGLEKLFKGVVFDHLAVAWERVATPNSKIVLGGRIRHREYLENGETKTILEVVGNKAMSKLVPEEVVDEFANYTPSEGF